MVRGKVCDRQTTEHKATRVEQHIPTLEPTGLWELEGPTEMRRPTISRFAVIANTQSLLIGCQLVTRSQLHDLAMKSCFTRVHNQCDALSLQGQ
jgi:hypothetical protein